MDTSVNQVLSTVLPLAAIVVSGTMWYVGFRSQNKQDAESKAILLRLGELAARTEEANREQIEIFHQQKKRELYRALHDPLIPSIAKEIYLATERLSHRHEHQRRSPDVAALSALVFILERDRIAEEVLEEWSERNTRVRNLLHLYADIFDMMQLSFGHGGGDYRRPEIEEIVAKSKAAALCRLVLEKMPRMNPGGKYDAVCEWVRISGVGDDAPPEVSVSPISR